MQGIPTMLNAPGLCSPTGEDGVEKSAVIKHKVRSMGFVHMSVKHMSASECVCVELKLMAI